MVAGAEPPAVGILVVAGLGGTGCAGGGGRLLGGGGGLPRADPPACAWLAPATPPLGRANVIEWNAAVGAAMRSPRAARKTWTADDVTGVGWTTRGLCGGAKNTAALRGTGGAAAAAEAAAVDGDPIVVDADEPSALE